MSGLSVFVVFGSAGEWCDSRRWAVCAFEDRAEAEWYAEMCQEQDPEPDPAIDTSKAYVHPTTRTVFDPRSSGSKHEPARYAVEEIRLGSVAVEVKS